jgi:hypothetical protein
MTDNPEVIHAPSGLVPKNAASFSGSPTLRQHA